LANRFLSKVKETTTITTAATTTKESAHISLPIKLPSSSPSKMNLNLNDFEEEVEKGNERKQISTAGTAVGTADKVDKHSSLPTKKLVSPVPSPAASIPSSTKPVVLNDEMNNSPPSPPSITQVIRPPLVMKRLSIKDSSTAIDHNGEEGQNKERGESERKVDEDRLQQQQQQDQQQTEREKGEQISFSKDGGYQQHFKRESLLTRIEDFLPSPSVLPSSPSSSSGDTFIIPEVPLTKEEKLRQYYFRVENMLSKLVPLEEVANRALILNTENDEMIIKSLEENPIAFFNNLSSTLNYSKHSSSYPPIIPLIEGEEEEDDDGSESETGDRKKGRKEKQKHQQQQRRLSPKKLKKLLSNHMISPSHLLPPSSPSSSSSVFLMAASATSPLSSSLPAASSSSSPSSSSSSTHCKPQLSFRDNDLEKSSREYESWCC
jgi:hypothetical protein